MRFKLMLIGILVLFFSCGEKLLPKPENLIEKEKMVNIIQDMALLNAAKSTNSSNFSDYNLDPTSFILDKYDVDSLQFVTSNNYYISIPTSYEEIYKEVEARLIEEARKITDAKRVKDSLLQVKNKKLRSGLPNHPTDSLP